MGLLLLHNHRVYRAICNMDLNVVARRHVGPAAHDRPVRTGDVTQAQEEIALRTGCLDMRVQPMQCAEGSPHRVTADLMYLLTTLSEIEPRGSDDRGQGR